MDNQRNDYIFHGANPDTELSRLQAIEQIFDPTTHTWLQATGLTTGQTCLELGPGAGSILRWLSEAMGATGKVVGIDRDPTHWQWLAAANVEKVIADLQQWQPEPAQFDLIHGRYILIHVPYADKVLTKLWQALKPGGVLVLEEPDFGCARAVNLQYVGNLAHQRVNDAIAQMFGNHGLDPGWGLKMPALLKMAGFTLEKLHAEQHLAPGQSAIAQLMHQSAECLAAEYLATGAASRGDLQTYLNNTFNPDFWAVYYATVRVIARRNAP